MVLALAATQVSAAIAGLPEAPTPGPLPTYWLTVSNDNLGDGVLNRDDFRTGAIAMGASWGQGRNHWAAAADSSVFTNRFRAGAPQRSDEITATLGYVMESERSNDASFHHLAIIGVGMRFDGDLGGGRLQDVLHKGTGYDEVKLPYDREHAADPLAFVYGRSLFAAHSYPAFTWLVPRGIWGISAAGAAMATAGGEQQLFAELDGVLIGKQGSTWFGARWRWNEGVQATPSAAVVAEHERGLWLVAGASNGPFPLPLGGYLTAGVNPRTHDAIGSIGLLVRPHQYRWLGVERVEHDFGYYSGAVIGFQYRWQPVPLQDAGPDWLRSWLRHEVMIDYRFGGAPHYGWQDDKLLSDQLLVGHAPTLTPPPLFGVVHLMPYVYGAGGIRAERIAVWGPNPRFPEHEATRGVIQMGFGLRVAPIVRSDTAALRSFNHLRVGAGYDRWFPFANATVANGADRDRYQQVNWGIGGYLGMVMDW